MPTIFTKTWWSKEPFLHICSSRYVDRIEDRTEIKVYSNLNQIALYKDGVFLEENTGSHIFTFEAEIEGEHIFEAKSGELSEKSACVELIMPIKLLSGKFHDSELV